MLVHGASGGVGIASVQWAKSRGLTVFATAGTQEGLELVRQQGADRVFSHRQEGYQQEILAATGGRGVDVVLEMLANVNLSTTRPPHRHTRKHDRVAHLRRWR